MSNSSWVPNEPPKLLFSERTWLQGIIVCAFAYGITVPLYILSFNFLMRSKNGVEFRKRIPLLVYATVIFLVGSLYMFASDAFTQMAFIDDRNIPGGPSVYETTQYWIPVNDAGNAAFVLIPWFGNALLVWRFKVIYQTCGVPIWITMIFPCLMLAASFALGVPFLIEISSKNPFRVIHGVGFSLSFFSISIALSVILTIAIALRLLAFRYRISATRGPRHGSQYTSISAMIIESAAIYSAFSFTFLILFGIKNLVSQVFISALPQFQLIASLLIVLRVAQGKGWTEDTAEYIMTGGRTEYSASASSGEVAKNMSLEQGRSPA